LLTHARLVQISRGLTCERYVRVFGTGKAGSVETWKDISTKDHPGLLGIERELLEVDQKGAECAVRVFLDTELVTSLMSRSLTWLAAAHFRLA